MKQIIRQRLCLIFVIMAFGTTTWAAQPPQEPEAGHSLAYQPLRMTSFKGGHQGTISLSHLSQAAHAVYTLLGI